MLSWLLSTACASPIVLLSWGSQNLFKIFVLQRVCSISQEETLFSLTSLSYARHLALLKVRTEQSLGPAITLEGLICCTAGLQQGQWTKGQSVRLTKSRLTGVEAPRQGPCPHCPLPYPRT